jgi:thiol:disulfide interchange protein DsbD
MSRKVLILVFVLFVWCGMVHAGRIGNRYEPQISVAFAPGKVGDHRGTHPAIWVSQSEFRQEYNGSSKQTVHGHNPAGISWLFIQAVIAGLLAVFTPYVYTIHPFTSGYLVRNVQSQKQKVINRLVYAASLIVIFTLLGLLISILIKVTGVARFTDHWIFNLFFFRIFITLGISFLGAFAIKLPAKWITLIANRAETNNYKGIFFMAVTLPATSFSSTFPIVGLVLLAAGKVSIIGPTIGLFGFAIGLSLPFVFPATLNVVVKKKSFLNNVKVIMGFFSLMIALKFLSRADVALDLHLLGKDIFIEVWMAIWAFMGIYLLGALKLSHDTEPEQNLYGQDFIPLSRLFIAIGAFAFAFYLLPGIWGAPLPGISSFLPQYN